MAEPLKSADYDFLRTLLRDRLGHDLGDDKEYLAVSRLAALSQANGLTSLAALFDRLRQARDATLEDAVLGAMLTGETRFFRSSSLFDCLRLRVLPALIKAHADAQRLNVWCAGCSTGQEPYSIAMLLADHFPELARWDVSILATDFSEPALRQAREGSYTIAEIGRGLPETTLRTHFRPHAGRWVIGAEARRHINFQRLNLADPLPFRAEFDIIFIRNVLIYFGIERKLAVFEGLRRAIKDDGYLFLGESETILGLSGEFACSTEGFEFFRPA